MNDLPPNDEVRHVDSFGQAFRDEFADTIRDLPSVADAIAREQRPGEPVTIQLPPDEASTIQSTLPWLLVNWIRYLADEVDRLHIQLEKQAGTGDDLDGQHDAS